MDSNYDDTLMSVCGQEYFEFALDLNLKLDNKEKALLKLLKDLDYSMFENRMGRPLQTEPWKLMVLNCYGAMNHQLSTRSAERLSKRDVFVMALLGPGKTVTHMDIARFRKKTDAIEDILRQMIIKLVEVGEINLDIVYQDGTKIESRAGRYTYKYRSNSERYIKKAILNAEKVIIRANSLGYCNLPKEYTEENCIAFLGAIIFFINENKIIKDDDTQTKGKGVNPARKILKDSVFFLERIVDNRFVLNHIGEGRNSLSYTDTDATMMHMKDDHFKNGQTKPGYNIQHLTCSDYITCVFSSQDRSDQATAIPCIRKFITMYGHKLKYYVADSGYDNLKTFEFLDSLSITAAIKPQNWEIRRKARAPNNPKIIDNMEYNEERDELTCINGARFIFKEDYFRKGVPEKIRVYTAVDKCTSCTLRKKCLGKKESEYDFKKIEIALKHMLQRKKAYDFLLTPLGVLLRVNRSIQSEGTFCHPKWNLGFDRFLSFGMERSLSEWLIIAIASNVVTYASKHARGIVGGPFTYVLKDSDPLDKTEAKRAQKISKEKTKLKAIENITKKDKQLVFDEIMFPKHKGKCR